MNSLAEAIRKFEDDVNEARGYPIYAPELSNLIASQVWGARMHHEGIGYVTPHKKLVEKIREDKYGLFTKKEIEVDGKRITKYAISMFRYHPFKATGIFYENEDNPEESFDWTQFAAALSGFYVQNMLGLRMSKASLAPISNILDPERTKTTLNKIVTYALYPLGWLLMKAEGDKIVQQQREYALRQKRLGNPEKFLDPRLENAFAYTLYGNYGLQSGDQIEQFRGNVLGMEINIQHLEKKINLAETRLSEIIEAASDGNSDIYRRKRELNKEGYKQAPIFGYLKFLHKYSEKDKKEPGKEKLILAIGNFERVIYNNYNKLKLTPYHRIGWK